MEINTVLLIIILLILVVYSDCFKRGLGVLRDQSDKEMIEDIYMELDLDKLCGDIDKGGSICKKYNAMKNILSKCESRLEDEAQKYNQLYGAYKKSVDYLYDGKSQFSTSGDDKLTAKMMDMTARCKQSMDNRAVWNKNSLKPYVEEELRNYSNVVWWEDDEDLEHVF